MQNNVLGIDIGNFNIKVVESSLVNGRMEIINYDIIKTPSNCINDGKITDVDRVAQAISQVLSRNGIKTKTAIGMVSSSALVTREVNIPKMKETEITKYIQLDSQQYFPMDLDSYVLDFKVLNEVKTQEGIEMVVLLAAIPELIINDYIKVFDQLKLDLLAIDIIPNILSKYTSKYLTNKQIVGKTVAVVDLGADNTTVSIVTDGVLEFSRMLPTGCSEITQSIASTYNLKDDEADEYKAKNGQIVIDVYSADGMSQAISEIIKPIVDSLISQVNKFFEFYQSRDTSNGINSIYLVGGGSLLKGIDKYFQAIFNITTRVVDISDGIVCKAKRPTISMDLPIILNAFAATYRE